MNESAIFYVPKRPGSDIAKTILSPVFGAGFGLQEQVLDTVSYSEFNLNSGKILALKENKIVISSDLVGDKKMSDILSKFIDWLAGQNQRTFIHLFQS